MFYGNLLAVSSTAAIHAGFLSGGHDCPGLTQLLAHDYFYPANKSLQLPWGLQGDQPLSRDLKPPSSLATSSLRTKTGLFRATPAAGQIPKQLYTACSKACCSTERGPAGSCTSQELPHLLKREMCAPQAAERAMQTQVGLGQPESP